MNVETELPVVLASGVLHPLHGQQWRELAIKLIEAGLDTPELHEVAWDPVGVSSEAEAVMVSALLKLGWRGPDRSEAISILLHHYSAAIVYGGADLLETFTTMSKEVIWPEIVAHESSAALAESHDMTALVRDYHVYFDDLAERAAGESEMETFLLRLRRSIADRLSAHPSAPSLRTHPNQTTPS